MAGAVRDSPESAPNRSSAGGDAGRTPRRRRRIDVSAYLYIAPGFAVVAVFLLYPLLDAAWISLYRWDGLSPATWVGAENYIQALTDPKLRQSFEHAAVLVVFYAVLPLCLALFLAAVLQRGARMRGVGIFQTLIFLPQVVAAVVIGVIWVSIYAPNGTLNSLLHLLGFRSAESAWLGDFTTALPAVGLIGTWLEIGLCLVLLVTGISQIPGELYDAARTDGAGPVREFFAVTLPSLRGSISVALTLTTLAALKTFDLVYVTTAGGPGTATTVPAFQVYNLAFNQGQVGMGTTIGIILTVLILIVTVAIRRISPAEER